jgi:hypothetical protein
VAEIAWCDIPESAGSTSLTCNLKYRKRINYVTGWESIRKAIAICKFFTYSCKGGDALTVKAMLASKSAISVLVADST